MTCRRPITAAVVRRTQVRAALDHSPRDLDCVTRIAAVLRASASRILRNATGLRDVGRMLGLVPIDRPFPHVADHVEQAVSVRRERHRLERCPRSRPSPGSPRETRPARYWRGVDRLAGTRRPTRRPLRQDRREPRRSHSASVGSVLPFPVREGLGVAQRHVDDRMLLEPVKSAVRSVGVSPVGTSASTATSA